MQRDDNIIKIARDMDSKKLYSLSNRLVDIFEDIPNINNEELSNNFDNKVNKFLSDLKQADVELYDRLVKTSAPQFWNAWKQKFYETMGGHQEKRKQREQEKQQRQLKRDTALIEKLKSKGFNTQIDQFLGYLETFSTNLKTLLNNPVLTQTLEVTQKASQLREQSVKDIQSLLAELKSSQDYNDRALAISVEKEANSIFKGMDQAIQTLNNAETSQTTLDNIATAFENINAPYKSLMEKVITEPTLTGTAPAQTGVTPKRKPGRPRKEITTPKTVPATPSSPAATATPSSPAATATPSSPAATATPSSPAATATSDEQKKNRMRLT